MCSLALCVGVGHLAAVRNVPPFVLTAARREPPVALLTFPLRHTRCNLQAMSMTMRAHVSQRDLFLLFKKTRWSASRNPCSSARSAAQYSSFDCHPSSLGDSSPSSSEQSSARAALIAFRTLLHGIGKSLLSRNNASSCLSASNAVAVQCRVPATKT